MGGMLRPSRTALLTTLAALAAEPQRTLIAQARAEGAAEILARLSDNLERYERGETCRSPWRKP